MKKGRLEAFSDGVIAIIITIMVLELKVPHEKASFNDLLSLLPVFSSYVLSFIYVGIYWNNHHHMFAVVNKINGAILWANMHLLFWLSMIPFATAWMGENHFAPAPMVVYGFVLFMCAIAYFILQGQLIRHHGKTSLLGKAVGADVKGKVSNFFYFVGMAAAFWHAWISAACYIGVALIWLVPDKRIENTLEKEHLEA